MKKEKIKRQFSKYASSYNQYASVQKQVAKDLFTVFRKPLGFGVDLGCGTGFVSKYFSQSEILGVDISREMINQYKKAGYQGVLADIEHLPFKRETFDFAVSSFSLHWVRLDKAFEEVYKVLKDKGKFLAAIPVENSLESFYKLVGSDFTFPSREDVLDCLNYCGFSDIKIELKPYRLTFQSGCDILTFFKKTGTSLERKERDLKKIREIYKRRKPLNTEFKILFFKAVKG